jgi:menaquinone-dependent protoporphyrinogen oxidase
MKRALVVYGTGTGCTAGIAERIGQTLASNGVTVEVVPAKDAPDPAGYDAVIVGSGIRAGSWHQPAKDWVVKHAEVLKGSKVALFTACLTLGQDPSKTTEVLAYTEALIAETGIEPRDIGLFAGWNEPKTFSFIERTILKMMKAPEGDFRDWQAIEAWAEAVVPKLGL